VALTVVAAVAVIAGRLIVRRVPVRMVHRVAGVVFAVFAVIAAVGAVRS
jgi:Ca2+/H+ antiporter, TMEM165/GDT1 family